MKADNNNIGKNGSGCSDPTAFAAICRADKDSRKKEVNNSLYIIREFLKVMGFELGNRIVLVDKQTGKKYE